MNPAAYLDADASALADREPPHARPRPRLTDTALIELEYAVDLLRRSDKAVSTEVRILRGLNLEIDWGAVERACNTLVQTAVLLHVRAQMERAGRAA